MALSHRLQDTNVAPRFIEAVDHRGRGISKILVAREHTEFRRAIFE